MKKHRVLRVLTGAAISAGVIYAINAYINEQATAKKLLPFEAEDFYRTGAGLMYYKKSGSGSPVILLHNLDPAASDYEWNQIRKSLEEKHTVYTVDLPGCGRSEKQHITYTNFIYVKAIHDFIRDMVIEGKPILVSTGYACPIALMLNAYDANAVKKLVFINPPTLTSKVYCDGIFAKCANLLLKCPLIGNLIYNIYYCHARIDDYFVENCFYNPFLENEDLADFYYESAHLRNGDGRYLLASIAGTYVNMDCTHAVKGLKTPALILEGDAISEGRENIHSWSAVNNKIEIQAVKNTKYLPQIEQPEETAEMILAYMDGEKSNPA